MDYGCKLYAMTLQLLFLENAGILSGRATSFVFATRYDDLENRMMLTPECVSPTELDVWIDGLKHQLDGIKKEVRQKYSAYDRRVAGERKG
jgi:hypothetical protein